jgi:Kdo2-lipid IVA lauroyltransferase/acyltransferase
LSAQVVPRAVTTSDARLGQNWTTAQRAKNFAIFIFIRICLVFVAISPRGFLRWLGRTLGSFANVALRQECCIADENLQRVFSDLEREKRNAIIRAMFRNLGGDLGDAAHAMTSGHFEALTIDDDDRRTLEVAHADGRGVLFVSAHLGPWEQVAASIVAAGFPLTTIARESYDPRLTRIYDRLRGRHGVRSIYRGDKNAGLRAMRCLKRGELLGVVMDLNSRVPSVDAPFLGKIAKTAIGPARLALRASARVVVATAAPKPSGGLRITVTAIETRDLDRGSDGGRVLTERINDELSLRIRALPERWVWMHRRFSSKK